MGTRAVTGPIDRAGSGVGCDVGCDVGCGGGTHRRRGAAGDRVMPDVRSRSLSPGSARAVDARERSDDSKNAFWLWLFLLANNSKLFLATVFSMFAHRTFGKKYLPVTQIR